MGGHPGQQRRNPARGPRRELSVERWDAIMAINLSSAFHATRLATCPPCARTGAASSTCQHPRPGGIRRKIGLRRRQAWRGGPDQGRRPGNATTGVTCNAICPGWCSRPWCKSRWMPRPPPWARTTKRPPSSLLVRKSPPCSSPPRRTGCAGRVLLFPGGQQRARRGLEHGWWLDGTIDK